MACHLQRIVFLTLLAIIVADEGILFCGETETCCNGVVHELLPDETHYTTCCGNGTLVFEREQLQDADFVPPICCGGVVYDCHGVKMSCCSKVPMNTAVQKCVNKKVVPWPPEDKEAGRTEPCGAKFHNPETEICCPEGNVIKRNNPDHQCCNDVLYDSSMTLCCEGNVYQVENIIDNQCCGSDYFTTDVQYCDRQYVKDEKTQEYKYRQLVVNLDGRDPTKSSSYRLCGNEIMSKETHICCDSVPKPFGSNPYVHCCGDGLVDYATYLCVNGKPVVRQRDDHEVCGQQTYFRLTQCCHNGDVFEMGDDRKCCYGTTYDLYTEGCSISGKVYEMDLDNDKIYLCERYE